MLVRVSEVIMSRFLSQLHCCGESARIHLFVAFKSDMLLRSLCVLLLCSWTRSQETNFDPNDFPDIFPSPPTVEKTTQQGAPVFQGSDGKGAGDCICVPYHNCDPNDVIKTDSEVDGWGVIDIRFGKKCPHYLDRCCTSPPDQPPPISTSPSVITPPVVTPPVEPPVTASPPVTPTPTPPPISIPTRPPTAPPTLPPHVPVRCGQRNPRGVEFSITGNSDREAEYGEFPWMVAILRRNYVSGGKDTLAVCGGSLIHQKVVLTGAHCFENPQGTVKLHATDIKVRAGEWDTQTEKERYPYQERNVAQIITHKDFDRRILLNDFALLVLESPVTWAANVKPVCLPRPGQVYDQNECYASGWGKTQFGKEGSASVILKKIDLPIVPSPVCQNLLRKTRLGPLYELHQSFICAGGIAGKDTCTGDGGGPLVCPEKHNPEIYTQAGIVAWGIGCNDAMVPGVYGNVALFRNWIDTQMNALGLDSSSYTV